MSVHIDQSWIMDAALQECIDAWLPDFIAAMERTWHPDSEALMERAVNRVRESFQDSYAAEVGTEPDQIDAGELLVAQEQTIQILYGCAAWLVAERTSIHSRNEGDSNAPA